MIKHQEKHPLLDDPDCFGCHIAGVMFGADTMPTRTGDVSIKNAKEKALQKDLPAFARMTKEGKQPPSLNGAHKYEAEAK